MPKTIIKILLIEDSLAEARFLQEILQETSADTFQLKLQLTHVKRLSEAIDRLCQESFDISLLDLSLPDSKGLSSLETLIHQSPSLPIVVLTNTNDSELAVAAVRRGAQDYLVKRQVNIEILMRSLRYGIERKQIAEALREANEALEHRVQERTIELARANEQLKQEIQHHEVAKAKLHEQAALLDVSTDAIFVNDLDNHILYWNRGAERLYGWSANEILGKNITELFYRSDQPIQQNQAIQTALLAQQDWQGELQKVTKANQEIWVQSRWTLMRDPNGQPRSILVVDTDITEKKQLEAQFLRAQRLESIGTLASGIAHDLNNILTPILAIAQLLPRRLPQLSEQNQQMLTTLEISAKRGAELIKQILSFTRGVEGNRVPVQASYLLSEIHKIAQQTFLKSIEVETDIDRDLWLISGDATQLHQVFMNLCVNARDAMPYGGKLSLKAENRWMNAIDARRLLDASMGAYIIVSVTDTGTGIPPEIIDRIFDPFFTTKAVGKGTGLGLSAAIGIVKSHGGFVEVQSTVGQGSQFQVYLPAIQAPLPQIGIDLDPLTGQNELILVVDDEVAICEMTKSMLEFYDYRVLTACNGQEAIELYAQHQTEISGVLLDLMMPLMDGSTTIRLLKQLNPAIEIVAMSGVNSIEVMIQVQKSGVRNFLQKPFTAKDLLQSIHRLSLSTHVPYC